MDFTRPRGTRDFTPEEMSKRQWLFDRLRKVIEGFNYRQIGTPSFEETKLFTQKSGDEITENLYNFQDKGGREICLRPEATASVARFFSRELRSLPKPVRIFYHGPMFRYERPQKGRYREFWQTGVELIGSSSPMADAEVISLASACMKSLNLDFKIRVNDLGVLKTLLSEMQIKSEEANKIISLMDRGLLDELSEFVDDESFFKLIQLSGSPDVIEDAKKIVEAFPKTFEKILDFEKTILLLKGNVDVTLDFGVARGLDYYTGMVFDVKVEGLGAQDQICGGGRYDNLIEIFGGPRTPSVGFAFGFDRLLESLEIQGCQFGSDKVDVVVMGIGDVDVNVFKIATFLREESSLKVELEMSSKSIGKSISNAVENGARFVVILGEKEIESSSVTVKDLRSENQVSVKIDELKNFIVENLK